jgi:hypothetical protein
MLGQSYTRCPWAWDELVIGWLDNNLGQEPSTSPTARGETLGRAGRGVGGLRSRGGSERSRSARSSAPPAAGDLSMRVGEHVGDTPEAPQRHSVRTQPSRASARLRPNQAPGPRERVFGPRACSV